mmetsp:Transcript_82609/g.130145  ORF Transcript_82609/g.130145 Transcript_82609/m.130145 type:complete len:236 (+) Transcript_82609:101-808(+)
MHSTLLWFAVALGIALFLQGCKKYHSECDKAKKQLLSCDGPEDWCLKKELSCTETHFGCGALDDDNNKWTPVKGEKSCCKKDDFKCEGNEDTCNKQRAEMEKGESPFVFCTDELLKDDKSTGKAVTNEDVDGATKKNASEGSDKPTDSNDDSSNGPASLIELAGNRKTRTRHNQHHLAVSVKSFTKMHDDSSGGSGAETFLSRGKIVSTGTAVVTAARDTNVSEYHNVGTARESQ